MEKQTYQLTLSSSFEEAEIVPSFVEKIARECALHNDTEANLMLLLSEAVTNAIVHGNKQDPDKKMHAELQIEENLITVTVSDEGEGFNPEVQKDPLQEENLLKSGGRGLFLIRELADSHEFLNRGNSLRFTLKRSQ